VNEEEIDVNKEPQAEVLDLGRQWADAESRGDAEALEALLADDFLLVGPLGFVLDKQEYLGSRRSADLNMSRSPGTTCGSVCTALPPSPSDLRLSGAPIRAATPPAGFV
jgi:hypothetical protein